MLTETEIRENLADAGCESEETERILRCICANDRRGAEKQIGFCRKRQIAILHESQKRIDRLDYLVWQMKRNEAN